eukprot:Colp12_sorted_trinity150504_noHs@12806
MQVKALVLLLLAAVATASQYDPHLPHGKPWFEGWYTRITDGERSLGVIMGYYPGQDLSRGTYAAVLYQATPTAKLEHYEALPSGALVTMRGGANITRDPDLASSPEFSVVTADSSYNMKVTADRVLLSVTVPNPLKPGASINFNAEIQTPSETRWDQSGEGPAGIAARLPGNLLGLQWFVHNLAAPAVYSYTGADGSTVTGKGHAHLEKNWGTAFPDSWVWGEAVKVGKEGKPEVVVAFAGGKAPVGPFEVPNSFLIGLRTPTLDWNFHPQDPALFFPSINACTGTLTLTARSAMRALVLTVTSEPKTYAKVECPTVGGFTLDSVETYGATIKVQAYAANPLDPLGLGKLIEEHELVGGALEFGGKFMCQQ